MKLLFTTTCVKSNIVGTPSHIFVMIICRSYLRLEFARAICRGFLPWNLPQLFAMVIFCGSLPWELTAAICRGNLPQLFAVAFCGNLPHLFAVAICRGYLTEIILKSVFLLNFYRF